MTKRVYEKPVYIAQTYVTASSIASNCDYHVGDPNGATPGLELVKDTTVLCSVGDHGHIVGQDNKNPEVNNYWSYAMNNNAQGDKAFLFDSTNFACDFVWNGQNDPVYGWGSSTQNLISDPTQRTSSSELAELGKKFLYFFTGNEPVNDQHKPGYLGNAFFS